MGGCQNCGPRTLNIRCRYYNKDLKRDHNVDNPSKFACPGYSAEQPFKQHDFVLGLKQSSDWQVPENCTVWVIEGRKQICVRHDAEYNHFQSDKALFVWSSHEDPIISV